MNSNQGQAFAVFKTSVGWIVWANFAVGLINFGALIYFTRVLGPTDIGLYGSVVVSLDLMWALFSFGFNQAVIREPGDDALYAVAFAAVIAQSTLYLVVALAVAQSGLITTFDERDLILWAGLALTRVAIIFATLLYAHQEASLEYRPIAVTQLLTVATCNFVAIVGMSLSPSITIVVLRDLAVAVGTLLSTMLFRHFKWPNLKKFRVGAIARLWRFSLGVWGLNATERLSQRLDYALAGAALGLHSFGIYFGIRSVVEGLLGFLIKPVQTTVYAYYCRTADNKEALGQQLKRMLPVICLFTAACAALAWAIGPDMLQFGLGPQFALGWPVLIGLTVYCGSMVWFELQKALAMAKGLHHLPMVGRVVQIIVVASLTVPVVTAWQLLGAGLVTGIAACLLALVTTVYLLRRLH